MSASIWYISKYISLPSSGRWGTRGFMLMREMARLGHDCLIITSDANHLTTAPQVEGSHLLEKVDGVAVCWLRTLKFKGAKSMGRIFSWLDFEWRLLMMSKRNLRRPDVVIVSSLSLLTVLNGLLLKWKYSCRLVFEVRDIWPLTIVEEGGFHPWNPFVIALGAIEKLGYRFADAIVGTMPNLLQHVDRQVLRHAPVFTIPFGLDQDSMDQPMPVPTDWLSKHVPQGKFVVCYAGTIGITNALDLLFACAREMRHETGVHFLIVGDGDLRSRYETECSDLPNVTFTGSVPKQMVQSVITMADLVYFSVHPSRVWQYGMSLNKIIDYMMSAKPILGSYTGYPTMIEEAEAGTIVPAGDLPRLKSEILRYRDMLPEKRAEIGARGRAWLIDNRQYSKLAKDYLSVALPNLNSS